MVSNGPCFSLRTLSIAAVAMGVLGACAAPSADERANYMDLHYRTACSAATPEQASPKYRECVASAYETDRQRAIAQFNTDYVKMYGYRMASFEILRRFLQIISNDDLNYGMKHFLGQDDIDSITRREHPDFKRADYGNPGRLVWAFGRLALARGLKYAAEKSKELIAHYANYPSSPDGFEDWHGKLAVELQEAYARFS